MARVRAAARVKRYTTRVLNDFLDSEYLWRNREALSNFTQLFPVFYAVLHIAMCSLQFGILLDRSVILGGHWDEV
jgi:hypothetical protein